MDKLAQFFFPVHRIVEVDLTNYNELDSNRIRKLKTGYHNGF